MSMPVPIMQTRLFTLRFVAILLCAAATIHIISTLSAMSDPSQSAYALLAKSDLPANTTIILPPVQPGRQYLPFMSADSRYAVCHFDTSKGPVSVSAVLPDQGWTIGIFHRDGSSAYFAAAPVGKTTQIALTLVPNDDRFMGLTPEARGKITTAEAPLAVSARQALVIVRAPDKGLSYAARSEAELAKFSCGPKTSS